jgi:hypothetical protein
MHHRQLARFFALLVCALVAAQWVLTAQSASTARPSASRSATAASSPVAKRPLSYDVVDSWRSIAGTKL